MKKSVAISELRLKLKEFFEPTKGKLIVFSIPEVILLYSYCAYANYVMIVCSLPCPSWGLYVRWIKPLIVVIPISIILYSISCLIVFAYDKSKRKNE